MPAWRPPSSSRRPPWPATLRGDECATPRGPASAAAPPRRAPPRTPPARRMRCAWRRLARGRGLGRQRTREALEEARVLPLRTAVAVGDAHAEIPDQLREVGRGAAVDRLIQVVGGRVIAL